MEGGLTPLYSIRFDLQSLLQRKLDTFRLLADKKQIRLSSTFTPDPLPPVFADAERLDQVLANLLNNAIFHTPNGGEVTFRVESLPGKSLPARVRESLKIELSKQWLKIEISDTGEGIPKEEWNRVFDKFYQINKSSNQGSGSGLGLAIARHIVEAHGGCIWVESSPAGGASFVFVLPQLEAAKEKSAREEVSRGRIQLQGP
jgi:signal transduction histidine kinase